jgi:alpha-beta hydrolase superfamily lysophospholipase
MGMLKYPGRKLRHLVMALGYGLLGLLVGGVIIFIDYMESRPDLSPWHTAVLDREFIASSEAQVADLEGYLALEENLFAQLRERVFDKVSDAGSPGQRLNRFAAGSLVDPSGFDADWNRSFELDNAKPRAAFLMLHGLSDSPYSMRALAEDLHARGASVVGLRLPGHGTAPATLARVDWKDFTAAVRLAVRSMRRDLPPGVPLIMVGYSNGAALAVEYTLQALEQRDLPLPAGLVLMSPALAVSPTAGLAKWSLLLGRLAGLEKLAWVSIQPEYDPYKYNSFPVNAGEQIYRLTSDIAARLQRLDMGQGVPGFPPILAFQSVVDATIPADGVVRNLLVRLAPNQHELVLFDINRQAESTAFFATDPHDDVERLLSAVLPFALRVVTNRGADSSALMERLRLRGAEEISEQMLEMPWPEDIFSLSHVALPFRPDDPIYGVVPHRDGHLPSLGTVDLRGETGVLQVPLSQFLRLRYNPFYDYLLGRVTARFLPTDSTAE